MLNQRSTPAAIGGIDKVLHGAVFLMLLLFAVERLKAQSFTNVTHQAGLAHSQWRNDDPSAPFHEMNYMTGGAAAGDFDGDGWVDLFVTRLDDSDVLYRNLGDGTFEDVSFVSGFTQVLATNGAVWGDVDNDGDQDLYVTAISSRQNYLYINDGAGRFDEQAIDRGAEVSTQDETHRFSASVGDYDRDGYLDLHTTNWGSPLAQDGAGINASRLLRNQGAGSPGSFTDVTLSTGVELGNVDELIQRNANAPTGVYGFASQFSDVDRDGVTDLIVAADFQTSRLFWGQGDGTFVDGTVAAGVGTDENGMGLTVGDHNGDGRLDIFITSVSDPDDTCSAAVCNWNASGNRLYENQGGRQFDDVTDVAGVRDGGWGWGASFLDFDNDGDQDLVSTNGVRFPVTEMDASFEEDTVRLWRNDGGGSPAYAEVAGVAGVDDTGSGKGLLTLDYDRDGDLDLFIVNNNDVPVLFRNDADGSQSWLQIETVGIQSNRDGIGATITLQPDLTNPDWNLFHEVGGGSNFLGQNERLAHFGLGDFTSTIDRLSVQWPSGREQYLFDVALNQRLVITEAVPEPSTMSFWGTATVFLAMAFRRTRFSFGRQVVGIELT